MLTSDITLHQIAHAYVLERQREAQTEHQLRALRASYLDECCAEGCCADGCCNADPSDEGADDAIHAPWHPVVRLGALQRAWRRVFRPRAPRYA
jgi:hypothetical protein